MKVLKRPEANERLVNLDGWEIKGKALHKEYGFNEFMDGLSFVEKVAALAEKQDHHPDVLLSYGKVVLEITTHSAGGLTEKDFRLATCVDKMSK